jgi:hypothetical protein
MPASSEKGLADMIPHTLYENIPYGCITSAALIVALQSGPLPIASAALLFFAGSLAWIQRSRYRRPDRVRVLLDPNSLIPPHRRIIVPTGFYEWLPFTYMAAGCSALVTIDSIGGQLAGSLLMAAGGIVWQKRHSHRMKPSVAIAVV